MTKIDSKKLLRYILATNGPANQLKLQKLLYYIEAWHLVFMNSSIIDDDFEAWVHGPVSRKIWDYLKSMSVLYNDVKIKDESKDAAIKDVESVLSQEQVEVIRNVLKEYGDKTAFHLENLTHSEEPWLAAREGVPGNQKSENKISKSLMKDYYTSRLNEQQGLEAT